MLRSRDGRQTQSKRGSITGAYLVRVVDQFIIARVELRASVWLRVVVVEGEHRRDVIRVPLRDAPSPAQPVAHEGGIERQQASKKRR